MITILPSLSADVRAVRNDSMIMRGDLICFSSPTLPDPPPDPPPNPPPDPPPNLPPDPPPDPPLPPPVGACDNLGIGIYSKEKRRTERKWGRRKEKMRQLKNKNEEQREY